MSVVPVRAVYHYQTQADGSDDDEDPSASPFMPPAQLAPPGRYTLAAAVAGICIWLLSGLTFLCLAIALCLGAFLEFIAYLDSMDARAERREALRRWQAAHYCGAHDVVFVPGAPVTYPPAAFARMMQPDDSEGARGVPAAAELKA